MARFSRSSSRSLLAALALLALCCTHAHGARTLLQDAGGEEVPPAGTPEPPTATATAAALPQPSDDAPALSSAALSAGAPLPRPEALGADVESVARSRNGRLIITLKPVKPVSASALQPQHAAAATSAASGNGTDDAGDAAETSALVSLASDTGVHATLARSTGFMTSPCICTLFGSCRRYITDTFYELSVQNLCPGSRALVAIYVARYQTNCHNWLTDYTAAQCSGSQKARPPIPPSGCPSGALGGYATEGWFGVDYGATTCLPGHVGANTAANTCFAAKSPSVYWYAKTAAAVPGRGVLYWTGNALRAPTGGFVTSRLWMYNLNLAAWGTSPYPPLVILKLTC